MFHKFRGVRRGGGRRFRPFAVPLALVLALSAGACSGGSSSDGKIAPDHDVVGQRLPAHDDQEAHRAVREVAPERRHQPDVHRLGRLLGPAGHDGRGRNTPDIIQQDFRYVHEYADRGALADLKQYMPSVINDSQLDQPALSTGQLDGKKYAIPTGVNAFALVVNPKLVKQAGVTLPDDKNWSWDDFVNTAAKITMGSKGAVHGTENMGYHDGGLQVFARQQGEDLFTADGKPGMSPATLKAWFNMIVKMRDTKAEPSASVTHETWSAGIDQSLLATNKGASSIWWTNQLGALCTDSKAAPRTAAHARRVAGHQARHVPASRRCSGRSRPEQAPQDAAQVHRLPGQRPRGRQLLLSDRGLPTNPKLAPPIKDKLSPADQKLSATFINSIRPGLAPPPRCRRRAPGDVENILKRVNEEVLFNQRLADDGGQGVPDRGQRRAAPRCHRWRPAIRGPPPAHVI